ncbi:hypothetical protein QFC24_005214 [Naganishia onofrii]|uniref:Uncharacterized protein n=1 Tax=Naganishia onofrii TaxID=1851511 RepID=A0ACC2XAX2_9TREE|nr:hypothetical protein QFC24_005214 [Naganishia onofrii]
MLGSKCSWKGKSVLTRLTPSSALNEPFNVAIKELFRNHGSKAKWRKQQVLEDPFYDRLEATILIDGQTCHTCWVGEKPYTVGETRVDPSFVEKQSTLSKLKKLRVSYSQPEDLKTSIWTFRFNYAPEAVLQAQGRIPIKHNISQGEAGLNATEPIDLDNEPGPSSRSTKEKKPKTAATTDENEPDAEEAALLAALERHRAKKRKQSSTFVELSDDDSDSKAAITRHMGKQLKIKKEKDGGKVDLTLDSD